MAGFASARALDNVPPLTPAIEVDARGHRCPVPTLRLRKALEALSDGQVARLVADDPMARVDVPHFADQAGHRVVESAAAGDVLSFLVEKHGAARRS